MFHKIDRKESDMIQLVPEKNQEKDIYREKLKRNLIGLLYVAVLILFVWAVVYLKGGLR